MNKTLYTYKTVRTALIVTTSYVSATINNDGAGGSSIMDCTEYNQLMLYVATTLGSLTSVEVKVEFSADNTTWYQETSSSISSGTSTDSLEAHTHTATGNYRIAVPISDRYIRVSVKGTGTVTSSSVAVAAVLNYVG